MNPTTDLDQLPPLWRTTIQILLGHVVALQVGLDDVQESTDAALDSVLAEAPTLRQAIMDQRLANLKAKKTEFDEMDEIEFDAMVRSALDNAVQSAIERMEPRMHRPLPVC